jgi:hypothetical protein
VNPVRCNVTLSMGRWQTMPTLAAVNNILEFYFGSELQEVETVEPEPDTVLQLDVTACTGRSYGHEEAVRDRIAEALLRRFQPEYESMVEVEIVYEPEEASDDPFGYVQDEWDDWDDLGGCYRVQQIWH